MMVAMAIWMGLATFGGTGHQPVVRRGGRHGRFVFFWCGRRPQERARLKVVSDERI